MTTYHKKKERKEKKDDTFIFILPKPHSIHSTTSKHEVLTTSPQMTTQIHHQPQSNKRSQHSRV